jgi:TIR domain
MPSISLLESKIKRLRADITRLESKRSSAMKDESIAIKKINSATSAMNKTKNQSTIQSKSRVIEQENKKIGKAKEDQMKAAKDISKKNIELNKTLTELSKTQQKEQEKLFLKQERKLKELYATQSNGLGKMISAPPDQADLVKVYDIFISHSADDKDSYVSELAKALKDADISIWYDTDNIGWGQSIRQEIDKGLVNSKYGIVIISPTFIQKYWTNYELDGILSKESATGKQTILPIWHNVTADQVKKYSYSLSGKLALNTAVNTIGDIVENVKKIVK